MKTFILIEGVCMINLYWREMHRRDRVKVTILILKLLHSLLPHTEAWNMKCSFSLYGKDSAMHSPSCMTFSSWANKQITFPVLLHLVGTVRLVLVSWILVEVIQPFMFPRSCTLLFPFQEAEPQMEGDWILPNQYQDVSGLEIKAAMAWWNFRVVCCRSQC